MVQITLLKSREATVVALVHVLHRRSCRDDSETRQDWKYLLDSPPPPHPHPLGCCFTPCIVGTFVHLQLHGCLVCSNFACGERSGSWHCCRLLKGQKKQVGWVDGRDIKWKELRTLLDTHCLTVAVRASSGVALQGGVHPALILLVLLAERQPAGGGREAKEQKRTIPELFQQLNSIYFANECLYNFRKKLLSVFVHHTAEFIFNKSIIS